MHILIVAAHPDPRSDAHAAVARLVDGLAALEALEAVANRFAATRLDAAE